MRTLPRLVAALALCASTCASAGKASAQHGTAGWGALPMDPRTSFLLETQVTEFDLPGRSGVWQSLSPRFEHAPLPWLSLAMRPGVAWIDYADGASAFGLADTELALKARAFQFRENHASVSVGLSAELPTGDAEQGTGNGHISLFPFVTFAAMPSRRFMLHAMLGDRLAPGGTAAHEQHAGQQQAPHGSVLMPHAEHELALHAGACIMLHPLVVSPGFELTQVLAPGDETYLIAQLELALVPRRDLRIAAGFDLPVLLDRRFEWRTRLVAALLW